LRIPRSGPRSRAKWRLLWEGSPRPLSKHRLQYWIARTGDGRPDAWLSIHIVRGHLGLRLLSHKYRHVHQYETCCCIASFAAEYLQQIALCGYGDAPLERDATAHELSDQHLIRVN
jgi:hypothetical protein